MIFGIGWIVDIVKWVILLFLNQCYLFSLGTRFPFSVFAFREMKEITKESFTALMETLIAEQENFEKSEQVDSGVDNVGKIKIRNEITKLSEVIPFRLDVLKQVKSIKDESNKGLPAETFTMVKKFVDSGVLDNLTNEDVSFFL